VKKIAVIGVNWLGDVVMTLPALEILCSCFDVDVITRPNLAEVYRLSGLPVNIKPFDNKGDLEKILSGIKRLRKTSYEACVIFPDSLRAGVTGKFLKSKKNIAFNVQGRGLFDKKLLNKPADFKKIHESELYKMLAAEACENMSYIRLPERERAFSPEFEEFTIKKYSLERKQYAVLAPGAAFGAAKRWPAEYFAELAGKILENTSCLPVITAGKSEIEIARSVVSCYEDKVLNLAGKTNLKELACILKNAAVLVANDSGTMHLASLFSVPTIVPVGPTDMTRTSALNRNFKAIIADNCELIPCRKPVCPKNTNACMKSISPAEVYEVFLSFLAKNK